MTHVRARRDVRTTADRRRLAWTLGLVVVYMVTEVVGGLASGSLALLADAGHMLSDAGSLSLALFALWMAGKPPTPQRTYGYYRLEVLAALANAASLAAISVFIFFEAVERLGAPRQIHGAMMMGIAAGGLLVNLAGLALLHGGRDVSLNVRGAWLHVLADTLGSVQALAAGALVWAFGWTVADPAASILIGVLVLFSAWSLLKQTLSVLMEASPGHIDVDQVRGALRGVAGVCDVHDLHVWTITSGLVALSAHLVATGRPTREVLAESRAILHQRFGIDHLTIQVEPDGFEEAGLCP